MDLKSGQPYFLIKNGLFQNYETLESDHRSDVVVLGGGISGALMAYQLSKNGIECIVIDKRMIGLGSTCASTSLLQYEIDIPLHLLEKKIGKENAIQAYIACSKSIDQLQEISLDIGFDDFSYCESLYFSHSKKRNRYLLNEFASRKAAGFDVEFLTQQDIFEKYGFDSAEAILSSKAARTDAYLFTHYLHAFNKKKGVRVFENTCIKEICPGKNGVELFTDKGYRINAKKIVHATGYESLNHLDERIVKLSSTYACISEKITRLPDFFERILLWNTDNPYLYIREDSGRIIVGGRDENYYDPKKRERQLDKKVTKLQQDFSALFPEIKFNMQFAWAGTFGSTKDGLPYIGIHPKEPHSYFALGFGGNGITFSAIAANLITEHIKKETNTIPEIYSFNR